MFRRPSSNPTTQPTVSPATIYGPPGDVANILIDDLFGNGFPQSTEGQRPTGSIRNPIAVAVDVNGQYVYATDSSGGGLLRKIDAYTGQSKTIALG